MKTAQKIGKSLPRLITVFGFVIVSVFLLIVTRSFFMMSAKSLSLQIPDSRYEKKTTQNEHIIAHFEYFFTCHYSNTVWLAENLYEIYKFLIMRKRADKENIFFSH